MPSTAVTAAPPAPPAVLLRPSDLSGEDRSRWQELLAERPDSAPFVDEAWVSAWSAAFRPTQPVVACAWDGDGRLVALGALQELTERWNGQRTRVLQSLTNVESFRYEFVAARAPDTQERLWPALCDARRYDVIRVEALPEDSETLSAGIRVARQLGWSHCLDLTFQSPWRRFQSGAWDDGLKRKFKSNLRNRERRLQAVGDVAFAVTRAGVEQRSALEVFYVLESSGWKGELGTAIGQRPSAKAFYDGLLERTAPDLWIATLSVAGRPAAAQLVRVGRQTLFLLKTAYDPAFAPYAPGQLITARLVRYGIDHQMSVLDFLGEDMTWKRDWEPELRNHYCLHLFAPTWRGGYAYWSRYGVRESVKRIPGARRLVRWVRSMGGGGDRGSS